MIFLIHPGNPAWQEPESPVAEDLAEAVEAVFSMETEDAVMVWGNQAVPVSYKYDMSVIAEDVIFMLECLRAENRGEETFFFSSDTFSSEWLMKWDDSRLFIDPTWNSVSENRHGELNAVGAAEVSVSHFVGQWTMVLEKIYEAVLMSGVTMEDRKNFDALGSLLGYTEDLAGAALRIMQKAEYHATILDNGQIPLPEEIRNQLRLKPDQEIRVVIEVPRLGEKRRPYSFERVRGLLNGIRGDMSSQILADRKDRI